MEQAVVFHVQMDITIHHLVNQSAAVALLVPTLVLLVKSVVLFAHLVLIAQLLQLPFKYAQLVHMLL